VGAGLGLEHDTLDVGLELGYGGGGAWGADVGDYGGGVVGMLICACKGAKYYVVKGVLDVPDLAEAVVDTLELDGRRVVEVRLEEGVDLC
jgi:hypothetical protein